MTVRFSTQLAQALANNVLSLTEAKRVFEPVKSNLTVGEIEEIESLLERASDQEVRMNDKTFTYVEGLISADTFDAPSRPGGVGVVYPQRLTVRDSGSYPRPVRISNGSGGYYSPRISNGSGGYYTPMVNSGGGGRPS